jgi:hypothetical protein
MRFSHRFQTLFKCSAAVAALMVCGCALPPTAPRVALGQSPSASTCAEFEGSNHVANLSGVVFIGERHGTTEIPKYVGAMICHATKNHRAVHVALELPEDWTASLNHFINTDAEDRSVRNFFVSPEWKKRVAHSPDGLTSKAMVALIEQLRQLRQQGQEIYLSTFDTREWEVPHINSDIGMAAILTRNIEKRNADVTFVLAGEYHTRLRENTTTSKLQPMAFLVATARPKWPTRGISVSFSAGSLWGCRSLTDCGVLPQPTRVPLGKPRLTLDQESDSFGYSGKLYVGPISPSPPFIQAEK